MPSRLWSFAGTDEEYIKCLENIVLQFNNHHSSCLLRQAGFPSPVTSTDSVLEPPPLSQASSSRKRKRSPQRFEIIEWTATEHSSEIANQQTTAECSPDVAKQDPRWKRAACNLIQATPYAKGWAAAIRRADLDGIIGTDKTASYLLDQGCGASLSLVNNAVEEASPDLLDHVRSYARSTSRRKTSASTLVKLAAFQEFLLLSACVVLRGTGRTSEAAVVEIVKICVGDRTERHCLRILDSVRYINCLIDSLNAHGWRDRAAELILLWAWAPKSYYHLACSADESLEYLREELTKPKFLMSVDQGPTSARLFIPGLVFQLLNRNIHMVQISDALGYKHTAMMFASNPWQVFDT